MSGEDSKRSGEIGEKLAASFLELIGWSGSLQSISVECTNKSHRTPSDNQKLSHGDDRVFIYNNPFYDSRTDIVHISVKNNLNGYSTNESTLKSELKLHVEEANDIISCAQYDTKLSKLLSNFAGRRHKEHTGLLIWTSSELKSCKENILTIVKNVKSLDPKCVKNVYMVDGARIEFFRQIIEHAKNLSSNSYEFIYPETGGLVNRLDERHGRILPLEMIVADVIPMKVHTPNGAALVIYVNQPFEQDAYRRALSFALGIAGAWPSEIQIGFPDFNAAHHTNDARAAEFLFIHRQKKFKPFCFIGSNLDALTNE